MIRQVFLHADVRAALLVEGFAAGAKARLFVKSRGARLCVQHGALPAARPYFAQRAVQQ